MKTYPPRIFRGRSRHNGGNMAGRFLIAVFKEFLKYLWLPPYAGEGGMN